MSRVRVLLPLFESDKIFADRFYRISFLLIEKVRNRKGNKMKRMIFAAVLLFCMAGCGMAQLPFDSETETKLENGTEDGKGLEEMWGRPERIVCWGDSLTFGEGGDGTTFPGILAEKTNLEVYNYGVQGETAEQIGIRMGAFPMTVGSFEIPAEQIPVEVSLYHLEKDPIMMRLGDCGINPCNIAGVEGVLAYDATEDKYYFTRKETGSVLWAEEGTKVETFAARDKKPSDIVILFAGSNRAPDIEQVGELIETENQMLEYLGSDRYLVIGLTSLALVPDVVPINEALAAEFGEHFLDIRAYLLERGLVDAGVAPTSQDEDDLEAGEIPSSLRVDIVHGNETFYRIIGEQVFEKLRELRYITEDEME